jgi:hypothetical protein
MQEVLTLEEAKELVRLCRVGKLYEVDDWIRAGRSLRVPINLTRPARS